MLGKLPFKTYIEMSGIKHENNSHEWKYKSRRNIFLNQLFSEKSVVLYCIQQNVLTNTYIYIFTLRRCC